MQVGKDVSESGVWQTGVASAWFLFSSDSRERYPISRYIPFLVLLVLVYLRSSGLPWLSLAPGVRRA